MEQEAAELIRKGGFVMRLRIHAGWIVLLSAVALVLGILTTRDAHAHCDTMDGPVVNTARMALEKGDVASVLKWVLKKDEAEIKEQFQ
jgi:hypothetical protein